MESNEEYAYQIVSELKEYHLCFVRPSILDHRFFKQQNGSLAESLLILESTIILNDVLLRQKKIEKNKLITLLAQFSKFLKLIVISRATSNKLPSLKEFVDLKMKILQQKEKEKELCLSRKEVLETCRRRILHSSIYINPS